jgi:hypothetical protein
MSRFSSNLRHLQRINCIKLSNRTLSKRKMKKGIENKNKKVSTQVKSVKILK